MPNSSNIDAKKMALIKEFQNMSQGKSSDDMLPLVLAMSKKSKSMGLSFSKEEMQLIVENFKKDMSPKEKNQLDSMMNMMNMFNK